VTLVQISRGVPLARYQRYEALNPIHILAVEKPAATGQTPARTRGQRGQRDEGEKDA